jgi:hypothetical protein
MDSTKKILAQVSQLCRKSPVILTAAELVGRTFLLLGDGGIRDKVRVLVEGLHKTDLLKLAQAAQEVDVSYRGADGFKLGSVYVKEEGAGGISFDDPVIPTGFVRELKRALELTQTPGASAAG